MALPPLTVSSIGGYHIMTARPPFPLSKILNWLPGKSQFLTVRVDEPSRSPQSSLSVLPPPIGKGGCINSQCLSEVCRVDCLPSEHGRVRMRVEAVCRNRTLPLCKSPILNWLSLIIWRKGRRNLACSSISSILGLFIIPLLFWS